MPDGGATDEGARAGATDGGARAGATDEGARVFRITAGQPSPEELAAVTAVLTAVLAARQRQAQQAAAAPARAGRAGWPDRAALLHAPLTPGPGAWRRSARPR